MADFELVVVGGGLASARAIKAFREAGGGGRIALFSRDTAVPYHRPPLSKGYLRGEQEAEAAFVEQPPFYEANRVDLFLQTEVRSLDVHGHRVELSDGRSVGYAKLLLATGTAPRKLDVPGASLERIFALRTLDDSTAIREAAREARRALIVGAGFIGMEVTASLRQLGVDVTLVHRGSGLYEQFAVPQLSRDLVELYRERGVEVVLEDEIAEFVGDGRLAGARTKAGRDVDADLAVVGIGVVPSVELVERSGLAVDNGVVVNQRFETSADDVYAVGDVARFYDPLFGRPRRIEHWSNANYQGTEVGKLLAGSGAGYDTLSTFFTEVFGTTIKLFGDMTQHDELDVEGSLADGLVARYGEEGRLTAALVVGQAEDEEERLKELIRQRARL